MKIDHLRQHHHVSEYITIAVLITLSNTDSALCVWFVTFFQDVLRHSFEKAVTRRMMSDVPWGVLLSGGLDSSLVASICARNVARRSSSFPKLHSFTIGLENSPDLKAAKRVADFLGTIHHAYTYTLEEGADAIRDVIRSIETYDVTTIRASTPMYLMSRKIKAMGIKMVLSGEGADEVFGGYLYFHKAPNEQEFFDETVDKISRLHMYDCLRANKAMSAWGVEPRCPFLDADFLQVAMNLDPKEKMIVKGPDVSKEDTRIEKYVIRKAFDTPDDPVCVAGVPFKIEDRIHHVLEDLGTGNRSVLRDMADQKNRDAALFRKQDQLFGCLAHLSHAARRGRQDRGINRLDGIDHDHGRGDGLDLLQDIVQRNFYENHQVVR